MIEPVDDLRRRSYANVRRRADATPTRRAHWRRRTFRRTPDFDFCVEQFGIDPARRKNIVNVSGGEDSTATYLLAIESGEPFEPVFADTGHELEPTLDYVRDLPRLAKGPPIRWVTSDFTAAFPTRRENIRIKWTKQGIPDSIIRRALDVMHPTGNPYLDLCLLRGGFPSSLRQFCTEQLKIVPVTREMYPPIWAQNHWVMSWMGIRRDESIARAHRPMYSPVDFRRAIPAAERRTYGFAMNYYPLIEWILNDVWQMHRRHGVRRNPLYDLGTTRVGCGPCIYARKAEIRLIANRFPGAIDRVREMERIVGLATKRDPGMATFFMMRDIVAKGEPMDPIKHGIDGRVAWSQTSRGGRRYQLFPDEVEAFGSCSVIGRCE